MIIRNSGHGQPLSAGIEKHGHNSTTNHNLPPSKGKNKEGKNEVRHPTGRKSEKKESESNVLLKHCYRCEILSEGDLPGLTTPAL